MSTSADQILESVRQLEDDFAEAMSHMYAVGNDLARLRGRLAREASPDEWFPAAAPAAGPAPTAPAPAAPALTAAPTPVAPAPTAAAATARPGGLVTPPPAAPPFAPALPLLPPVAEHGPALAWWQREGFVARVLAVVGAGITLIGVAFLLVMAIQMGFFGPLARVLSGALLSAALIGAAVVVRGRTATTNAALGLAATGVATGYLDVLAVTRIYEWMPAAAGLVIAGLLALGGLLLARAWGSQLLALIVVLGVVVLAPAVGFDHLLLTGGFLVVLALAAWPAQIRHDWHLLEIARVAPVALYLCLLPILDEALLPTTLLAVTLAGFVLVTSVAGQRDNRLPTQLALLVPVAALPVVVVALAAERWPGTWLLLGLTGVLVLAAVLSHEVEATPWHHRLVQISLAAAGVVSVLAAGRHMADSHGVYAALLAVGLAWSVAALALHHAATLRVALGASAFALITAMGLTEYVLYRSAAHFVTPEMVLAALLAVVVLLVLARAVTTTWPEHASVPAQVLLGIALLWAGGAVILGGSFLGWLMKNAEGGFTAGQTGATLLWLGTAALLLLRGLRGSSVAVPAGLTITALSVGKLLFFDLAYLDGIPRVLSFIVGGLIVLGMGAGYAQALERSRRTERPEGPEGPEDAVEPVENSTTDSQNPPTV